MCDRAAKLSKIENRLVANRFLKNNSSNTTLNEKYVYFCVEVRYYSVLEPGLSG